MYNGYGRIFKIAVCWSFDKDTARNVITFGVCISLSSHVDKPKNNFLVLGVGPTSNIDGSFSLPDKKFSISFSKTRTKFCLSFQCNADNNYFSVNGKDISENKIANFQTQFCLGSISNGFNVTGSRQVSSNGNVYDFSVDYNSIDK